MILNVGTRKTCCCCIRWENSDIKKDTVDGVQVTINHQNGLKTIYANLDEKLDVKVGDEVKKRRK